MVRIEKHKCEQCSRETRDLHNHKGWIRFAATRISVSDGRKKSGNAKSRLYQNWQDGNEFDFCSRKCLLKYFKKLLKNRK